jgi:hypothetical protein
MPVFGFKMQMKWTSQGDAQRKNARRRRKKAIRRAYRADFDVLKTDFGFDGSAYDVEWTIEIDRGTQAQARAAAVQLAADYFAEGFVQGAAANTPPDVVDLP